MSKSVNLPFEVPVFASSQLLAAASIAMTGHPTAFNQVLHQTSSIFCTTKFLQGFTTPQVTIPYSRMEYFSFIEWYPMSFRFTKGEYINIIKRMLEEGFYVYYDGVDDYYLPNKSWYGTRHMVHDGIICGYDEEDETLSIAAHDINWVFRLIRIPIASFEVAVKESFKLYPNAHYRAYRVKEDTDVEFNEKEVLKNLKIHMDSDFTKYPVETATNACGTIVHEYIAMYLDKLLDGSIPYEKMDWRALRPVWEHKKCMLMRIRAVEAKLGWDSALGDAYMPVVDKANRVRMAYAVYHRKRRDSMLEGIRNDLLEVGKQDRQLVGEFINKLETV